MGYPPPPRNDQSLAGHSLPVKTVLTLTWANGGLLEAEHAARFPNETAAVKWSGEVSRVDAPPLRCDSNLLEAYLRHQAELTEGTLTVEREGTWPRRDLILK